MSLPAASLVVVFGHENDRDGVKGLSKAAQLRCATAADLLRHSWTEEARPAVLLTGAFGENFNTTAVPHHRLLRDHLLGLLPSDLADPLRQHLHGTPTSFTLEDVAYVRRYALRGGYTRIILITNRFHQERVSFYARKLLPDFEVDYHEADDPAPLDPKLVQHETDELKKLQHGTEWVDVPLPAADGAFPEAQYDNAFDEHKHDDTVSYWLLAAAFGALFAPHLHGAEPLSPFYSGCMYLGGALAGLLMWRLYLRYANFASVSRQTMRIMETVYFAPGFSYNHRKYHRQFGFGSHFNSRRVIGFVVGLFAAANVATGLFLLDWHDTLFDLLHRGGG